MLIRKQNRFVRMAAPSKSLLPPETKRTVLMLIGVLWFGCVCGFLLSSPASTIEQLASTAPGGDTPMVATALPRAPYAEWVHGLWLMTTTKEAEQHVHDADKKGIRIAAVVLKDPFVFEAHPTALAELTKLVRSMKARRNEVRVVVTVDGVVPEDSTLYKAAKENGYLVDGGTVVQQEDGRRSGALVDFRNPKAIPWLETLLNPLLKTGVEGVFNPPTDAAYMAHRMKAPRHQGDAMEAEVFGATYYYELFDFGRKVAGFDFVTAFRPVDTFAHMPFRALGPQDISVSSIVAGDKRPCDFSGIKDAALHMLHSADRGYINVGMGVCTQRVPETTPELFERWVQLAALSPLVLIDATRGGSTNVENHRAPFWQFMCATDAQCSQSVVRSLQWHLELRPYLHAQGSLTFLHSISADRNQGKRKSAASFSPVASSSAPFATHSLHTQEFLFHDPDSWDYLLGPDLFVAPILNASIGAGSKGAKERHVRFPNFGQWVPFGQHRMHEHSSDGPQVYSPRTLTTFDVLRGEALVFQRRGSVVPMDLNEFPGVITFVIASPQYIRPSSLAAKYIHPSLRGKHIPVEEDGTTAAEVEFGVVLGEHDHGMVLSYSTPKSATGVGGAADRFFMNIRATPYHKPVMIRIQHVHCDATCRMQTSFVALGFHEYTDQREFLDNGPRGVSGVRAVYLGPSEVLLYDPFASLGSKLNIGPLQDQWS